MYEIKDLLRRTEVSYSLISMNCGIWPQSHVSPQVSSFIGSWSFPVISWKGYLGPSCLPDLGALSIGSHCVLWVGSSFFRTLGRWDPVYVRAWSLTWEKKSNLPSAARLPGNLILGQHYAEQPLRPRTIRYSQALVCIIVKIVDIISFYLFYGTSKICSLQIIQSLRIAQSHCHVIII